jgi:putative MFS transporter
MIPESPRWLASKGRGEEAAESLKKLGASEQLLQQAQATPEEAPAVAAHNVGTGAKLGELFTPRWIRSNVLSWSLWISVNFAYFGVLLWLPSILVDVYHLSIVRSLTYTVIVNSVGMAGRLLGVYLIERIGRKPLIIYTYIFAALFCLAFGNVKDPRYLLLFAAMFFFFADQSSVGVIAYIPELYPTRLRVLGSAWAAAAGRIASALAPIMAGAFMAMKMYATTWTIFAAVYIAAALITWAIGPETTGRELTELQG